MQVEVRLLRVNAASVSVSRLMTWWWGLSVIEQRIPSNKSSPPDNRNPKPETRNPEILKPRTRNPKPENRNPEAWKPGARNPKPETQNPKPET